MQRAELFEHPVRCLNMILRGQGNDIVNISPVSTLAKSFEVQRSEVHAKDVSCLAVRESGTLFQNYILQLPAQRFRSTRAFYMMMAPSPSLSQETVS